jgi:hypothetical protein
MKETQFSKHIWTWIWEYTLFIITVLSSLRRILFVTNNYSFTMWFMWYKTSIIKVLLKTNQVTQISCHKTLSNCWSKTFLQEIKYALILGAQGVIGTAISVWWSDRKKHLTKQLPKEIAESVIRSLKANEMWNRQSRHALLDMLYVM